MLIIFYKQMLGQRINGKQNIQYGDGEKSGKMLYRAIQMLKKDKQNLVLQHQQREKYHQQQKRKLKLQVQGYKRKISELSEMSILGSLVKKDNGLDNKKQYENATKMRKFQVQIQHYKQIVNEKDKVNESYKAQIKQLLRKNKLLIQDKEKHLQISLTQKISLQQKIEILQQQTESKKRIIESLKKELQRVNKIQMQVSKREKEIVKRGKDMKKYEQQFQSYYSQSQLNYKRKIQQFKNENDFLRKEIKKIAKKIKITCNCEGEAEQWKQKLYQVGRQLARARVQLSKAGSKNNINKNQPSKQCKDIKGNQGRDSISDESIGSLTLSQQSSDNQTQKTTQKKR